MKKCLLFVMGFFMVSICAMAYSTNGEFNSFGVKCTEDNTNSVQKIELQQAGAFANFVANGDFNANFDASTFPKVVFEGPMNADDIAALKTEAYQITVHVDDPWGGHDEYPWVNGNVQNCTVLDFSGVTTSVAPLLKYNNNYGNGPHSLVIWPAATNPTTEQLVQMYNLGGTTDFAYYTDNNPNIIKFPGKNVVNDKFDVLLDELATLVSAGYHTFQAIEFAYSQKSLTEVDYNTNIHNNGQGTAAPAFLTKLAQFPVASINFQGLNLSSLGKNFSNLNNAATHYIVLPVNNSNGYAAGTDFATYTYPSNIYVAAAYAAAAPYGGGGDMGGQNYNIVHDTFASSITMTYVIQHGLLQGGAPYLPSVMQNADKMVMYGTIDAADLAAINHMTCPYVDLSEVTLAADVDITNYDNETTQYLALPNNTRKEEVDEVYDNCSSIVCVGTFVNTALAETDDFQAVPANTLITYSREQGSVAAVQYMVRSLTGNRASNVNNIIMSGYLNAVDICNSTAGSVSQQAPVVMGDDGHLYAQGNLPDGVEDATTFYSQNNGTLFGASLATVDFTNAIFDQPSVSDLTPLENCNGYFSPDEKKNLVTDMNFVSLAIVPSTKLLLPTDASQKVIPAYFMSAVDNDHCVESICIPYNFQYIMDYAFNGCGHQLAHIYTSKGAGDSDLVDGVVDHGYTRDAQGKIDWSTYTISSNVKYIAVGAFDTNTDAPVGDVYVLAKEAPICEKDAFCSNKYFGNNGFINTTPVCRDNYVNGNSWIAVLHFPNALNDEAKKKYTDIDRRYFLHDETGAVDGDGNPIAWPVHSEFMRSWHQALTGYTWNDWSTNRCEVEQDGRFGEIFAVGGQAADIPATQTSIAVENSEWRDDLNSYEATGTTTTFDNQRADCDKCGFESYIGWHQFLLARSDYFYEHEDVEYKQTPWYSFCVPYNMTRDELMKYLGNPKTGEEAEVRTLVAVKRNTHTNFIDVVISQDLVNLSQDIELTPFTSQMSQDHYCMGYKYVDIHTSKLVENTANVYEDVYVKGGYPYFVRGWIPKSEPMPSNLGAYVLAKAQFKNEDLGNLTKVSDMSQVMYTTGQDLDGYVAMPFFSHTVDAIAKDYVGQDVNDKPLYEENFYGNNQREMTLPDGYTDDIYKYNFVGNYNASNAYAKYIPAGTYYMSGGKIYRSTQKKNIWKPWICVISHNGVSSAVKKVISETDAYLSDYQHVLPDYLWANEEFSGEEGNADAPNAAKFAIFFEEDYPDADGMTTGVRNISDVESTASDNKVYSISGQCVGTSTNGLQKGIYVINGKKVIVE